MKSHLEREGEPQNTVGVFTAKLCVAVEYYVLVENTALLLGTGTSLANIVRTLVHKKRTEKRSLENV